MERIRIEVLCTLKGSEVWPKGRIFDSADGPIPQDVLNELKLGNPTVREVAIPRGKPKTIQTEDPIIPKSPDPIPKGKA